MSIRGEYSSLTEQHIGQVVFGKSAGYSPVEDSSVRVHIRQLRLKLHEYFDSEGRDEALMAEVPKGGYTLCFRSVSAAVGAETPTQASPPQKARMHWVATAIPSVIPWIAVAVLSLLALFLWQRSRIPGKLAAALAVERSFQQWASKRDRAIR